LVCNRKPINECSGWLVDADSRPSFAQLRDEFLKMSRDPARYLVIKVNSATKFTFWPQLLSHIAYTIIQTCFGLQYVTIYRHS